MSQWKKTVFVVIAALISIPVFSAARITIVNLDLPGQGLNDPTPVPPVGINTGTTLGEQRLNVMRYVAEIWGATLDSDVEITVGTSFQPLLCDATRAVLAATGGRIVRSSNPPPGMFANTWYPTSLGSRLAGTDLDPGNNEINMTVNSTYGVSCQPERGFYLGMDNNFGTRIDLVAVMLHEMAHGLGFSTSTNGSTGAQANGFPHIYDRFLFDRTQNLHWHEMTDAQRSQSAVNTLDVVWGGAQAAAATRSNDAYIPGLTIDAPPTISGRILQFGLAVFGPSLRSTPQTGLVAAAQPTLACETISNPAEIAGKMALVDRGTCPFVDKARYVQAAGATAMVVVNNQAGVGGMAGEGPDIRIPSVMVATADGARIRNELSRGVILSFGAYADAQGRPFVYTPNPFQGGSSVAHFASGYSPALLMEPANSALPYSLDLTVRLFADEGWFFPTGRVNRKVAFYRDGGTASGLYLLANSAYAGAELRLGDGFMPSWAPYGQRLAVAKYKDTGATVIKLINADGSGDREITNTAGYDLYPSWSPDGNRVAFVRDETGGGTGYSLYVVDVEGRNLRRLTRVANVYDLRPTWSPDGTQLMYSRLRPDGTRAAIYRINLDGTDERRITSGAFKDLDPDWAPDGSSIVFSSDRAQGNVQIFSMNPDGSNIRQLTQTETAETEPRWSPDSQKITFVSQRRGSPQIFTMNRDGSMPEPLTAGVGSEGSPAWQGLP